MLNPTFMDNLITCDSEIFKNHFIHQSNLYIFHVYGLDFVMFAFPKRGCADLVIVRWHPYEKGKPLKILLKM